MNLLIREPGNGNCVLLNVAKGPASAAFLMNDIQLPANSESYREEHVCVFAGENPFQPRDAIYPFLPYPTLFNSSRLDGRRFLFGPFPPFTAIVKVPIFTVLGSLDSLSSHVSLSLLW